jgi:hypothetical protein
MTRLLDDPLTLPPGELPGPDDGIGDAERSRRLTEFLDQVEDDRARTATARVDTRSTA